LGVACEVGFAARARSKTEALKLLSDTKVSEAKTSAAQAIERAAKLEKEAAEARERTAEIEKLTAWRRIRPEQYRQIVEGIRGSAPSLDVLIQHELSDPEAFSYAREIALMLMDAGVEKVRFGSNSFLSSAVFGLITNLENDGDASVLDIFARAGIPLRLGSEDTSKILPRNERAPNWYIFVAPKPPPPYQGEAPLGESNI
jgi:hypothetical protein